MRRTEQDTPRPPKSPGLAALALALTVLGAGPFVLLPGTLAGQETAPTGSSEPPQAPAPPDPLASLGFKVTGGAAPGYVEDRACAVCHNDLWQSYQAVGMARSFARPRAEVFIEDFEHNRFHHEPSDRWYEMRRDGDRLIFRRWQQDSEGKPVHVFEREVDWILGSGHTSRVYLYQTPEGELYQLPLAWYSQDEKGRVGPGTGHWGMAPGFDRAEHLGVQRLVHRECMFCHNAYPDVPVGSDVYGQPHVFPEELPQGTGCQRCHGPGARHVRLALTGGAEKVEDLRATIVNPGRLSDDLRNSVCYECHLQPTVSIFGVRRFGRGDYSFRPSEPLTDYVLKVDVDEEGRTRADRFEINHHPYRLEQSRCFRETQGKENALSCLTCHDPHRKVPAEERAAHYRQACLGCHDVDACRLGEMGTPEGMAGVDPQDCVTCHMPRRRTQDVVQVVMTDHRIQRHPPGPERLAPLAEKDPVLTDIELLTPLEGPLAEVYRIIPLIRSGSRDPAAVAHLERALAEARPEAIIPYLDLARGQLATRRPGDAEVSLRRVLDKEPENYRALSWMVPVQASLGHHAEALAAARKTLEADPTRAETHYNLGRLLLGYGRPEEAVSELERALELRPEFPAAWFQLGQTRTALDQPAEAQAAYRRCLEIEPRFEEARAALAGED
jgi:Tfp pilus assembly protein PilF